MSNEVSHTEEMNDQLQVRREKLQNMRDQNIDPFGGRFERTALSNELHKAYDELTKEEIAEKEITVT